MAKEFYTKSEIEVDWTGSYPNLCSGSWIIKINGVQLVDKTDDTKGETNWKNEPRAFSYGHFMTEYMETSGTYSSWHFEDWSEVFEDYYEGGEHGKCWFETGQGKKLAGLLKDNGFDLNDVELEELYEKISDQDWRSGSCGGCI